MPKDVPEPFRQSKQKPPSDTDLDTLLGTGKFRQGANLASSLLKNASDSSDVAYIFSLWYIRLACLVLLDYHIEAAQEARAFQDLNGSQIYRDPQTGAHYASWALRVLTVRLGAIGYDDCRRAIAAYYELAREARWYIKRCREKLSKSSEKADQIRQDQELWNERLQDLGVRVGNALSETGDLETAVRHLRGLKQVRGGAKADSNMNARIALVFLRLGDVGAARNCFSQEGAQSDEDHPNQVSLLPGLIQMCSGQYEEAITVFKQLRSSPTFDTRMKSVVTQNLAVCLIYSGKITEVSQWIIDTTRN